eukprot:TRINITY_DN5776_c0_g3_i5.p1 TRINITY_DN5776_c0_g3~~TRINITY_DN5776_c0_g3_i5.p1  ORF type:complete len:101 (+),score=19.97 TRINITY_DN5776_c0_g3_i5:137-439(+)
MFSLRNMIKVFKVEAPYLKYGLVADDLVLETPEVRETLRRLHPDILAARDRRMKLAFDCSMKKTFLPPDLWTKPEEDIGYLEPTLSEVENETEARRTFRL